MPSSKKYAIIDLETTGGMARRDKIIEIAIVIHDGKEIVDQFSSLIHPERSIPHEITRITGITNEMVVDAPKFYELAKQIVEKTENTIFVAHNVRFDYSFLREEFKDLGFAYTRKQLCTVKLMRKAFPGLTSYSLGNLIREFDIKVDDRHRALDDALATSILFEKIHSKFDQNDELDVMINHGIKEAHIPKGISLDQLHELPEETGVYYFLDKQQQVKYIGKAKNIKSRVFQHFRNFNAKGEKLYRNVHDIAWELTGNELASLLLEAVEIKTKRPEINRAMKKVDFPYATLIKEDEHGFKTLEVVRKTKNMVIDTPILREYSQLKSARQHLVNLINSTSICQNKTKCRGLNTHVCSCLGNCITIDKEGYNEDFEEVVARAKQLFDFDFFIVEKGREKTEACLILIEQGKYQGFGYLPKNDISYGVEEMKEAIKIYPYYPILNQLIHNYLNENKAQIIKI